MGILFYPCSYSNDSNGTTLSIAGYHGTVHHLYLVKLYFPEVILTILFIGQCYVIYRNLLYSLTLCCIVPIKEEQKKCG